MTARAPSPGVAARAGAIVVAAVIVEGILVAVARMPSERDVASRASIAAVLAGDVLLLAAVAYLVRSARLIPATRASRRGALGVAAAVLVAGLGGAAELWLPRLWGGVGVVIVVVSVACLLLGTVAWRSSLAIVQFAAMVLTFTALVSIVVLLRLEVPAPDRMLDSAIDPGFDATIGDGPTYVFVTGILLIGVILVAMLQTAVLALARGLRSRSLRTAKSTAE